MKTRKKARINVEVNGGMVKSIFSEKFDGIFIKADEHNNRSPSEANEEENFKKTHSNECK